MKRKSLVSIIIIAFIITSCSLTFQNEWETPFKNWLYQLQNADPFEIASSGFELAVIDYSRDGNEEGEYSPEEIKIMLDAGVTPVAYLNIGQAEDYRFYWKNNWYENPPEWLGEEDPMWEGNYFVKYWDPEWKKIIFSYIDRILSQGFKGVYLDRIDSFEYWSSKGQIPRREAAICMIDFIENIAEYIRKENPDILIIPQNGENILEFDDGRLLSVVSGWSVENLFYFKTNPLPDNETENRIRYLDTLRWHGKFILSVDYVDDGSDSLENLERILDYYKKCQEKGYIPYAARSDLLLDEINVIEGIQPVK
ncbi:MJ1477/TM1410 family putative glycoside hydrolase [Thermotoga sp. SG1]|uniref:MJ1477/TM1410 family putative glycoside hydrolase n=1 Tax=Thermotoga sp. SG1 TaxID=126739 RepID=UPI000C789FE0|nr:MJ1477/TM1410 family putative glycoside hydrolase [Thermotoga sp. SG1]PLV55724.1 hypothetical protein AS006_08810 [Thermotoga sp. SG1]